MTFRENVASSPLPALVGTRIREDQLPSCLPCLPCLPRLPVWMSYVRRASASIPSILSIPLPFPHFSIGGFVNPASVSTAVPSPYHQHLPPSARHGNGVRRPIVGLREETSKPAKKKKSFRLRDVARSAGSALSTRWALSTWL